MRINCGPTAKQKRKDKQRWHKWFAWYPVKVGPADCRWLEKVWRKGFYTYSSYPERWDVEWFYARVG